MSDLGLSHFTRRYIEEAAKEEGEEAGEEGGEDGNNKTILGGGNGTNNNTVISRVDNPSVASCEEIKIQCNDLDMN